MKLTLALSKGRIFEESMAILSRVGIRPLEDPEKSRKLILETSHHLDFCDLRDKQRQFQDKFIASC